MPRMGRVILPNYPHHVVQRGHNRQVVFAESSDYLRYLDTLWVLIGVSGWTKIRAIWYWVNTPWRGGRVIGNLLCQRYRKASGH